MAFTQAIFRRAELLLGDEVMSSIGQKRVIIFGVGGVGSWCAESLVRSGITHLTIVDSDRVCITNINRQLMATSKTVGQVKVEALKERLLSINPQAEITALQQIFTAETADSFDIGSYDYIIDAIDSLKDKTLLILMATQTQAKFYSSMGAALKLDPTRIKTAEFWKVRWLVPSVSVSSATGSTQNTSSNAYIPMNYWKTKEPRLMTARNPLCSISHIPTAPWLTSPPSSALCWRD